MTSIKSALYAASFVAVSLVPLAASSAGLVDVVRETLTSNPDVQEARNQLAARDEEINEAKGGFRPSVDLNAGIGYEYTDSPGTRAALDDSNELTRKELGLNVTQMLWDGRGTESEVERQTARRDSAVQRLRAVADETAIEAAEAFVDLGRFRALREISAESLATHKRIQDQIKLRSKAGVGRRADFDQINARVALAEVNLVAADVNMRDARTTFERVVGRAPGQAEGELVETPPPSLPGSLDEALEVARNANPTLGVALADVEAAKAQHKAARQFDYPRFDLEVGGNRNDDVDGIEGRDDDFTAMIRLRYNLYRGGSDEARKKATAFNINEARDVRDRAKRQLDESIRLAWASKEATRAQLPLYEAQAESATATRDAYAKQFNIGQRTLLDVLNSEIEVTRAQQSIVDTRAENLLAQLRLLQSMGTLVERLGVDEALTPGDAAPETAAR